MTKKLIAEAYEHVGHDRAIILLDKLKNLGYEYATVAGFSISVAYSVSGQVYTHMPIRRSRISAVKEAASVIGSRSRRGACR